MAGDLFLDHEQERAANWRKAGGLILPLRRRICGDHLAQVRPNRFVPHTGQLHPKQRSFNRAERRVKRSPLEKTA
jgi:hypothetical protein